MHACAVHSTMGLCSKVFARHAAVAEDQDDCRWDLALTGRLGQHLQGLSSQESAFMAGLSIASQAVSSRAALRSLSLGPAISPAQAWRESVSCQGRLSCHETTQHHVICFRQWMSVCIGSHRLGNKWGSAGGAWCPDSGRSFATEAASSGAGDSQASAPQTWKQRWRDLRRQRLAEATGGLNHLRRMMRRAEQTQVPRQDHGCH